MRVQHLFLSAVAAVAISCATPPKPAELTSFERLRADSSAKAAVRRAPDLVRGADTWLTRALKEWEDNDLEEARNSAIMGQIKLKHAIAVSEQASAKARIAEADRELERASADKERLAKDLAAVNELVTTLRKLQEQQAQFSMTEQKALQERQALAEQLEKERIKASAADRISDAELALKSADSVKASVHATAQHASASDMFARAQQEFQQGSFAAAQTSAELARKKAEEAAQVAKPLFTQEAQGAESRAQSEALARDAAALTGVAVRREARGSLQRLVVPLSASALFNRREPSLSPGKEASLDPIATLIKKYPTYPVQVVGYTDTRGKMGELLALSLARAQSVFSALVYRGVDAKRMVVSGQGGADPIADNRTAAGRARNNRIEIVFLYQ